MNTLGPGDVVADRYDLIRALGGGEAGRVYVALDRRLGREVALRFVEPGDSASAETLLEEARRMSAVRSHSPAGLTVLDAGELPGGGAFAATELVGGVALEEVARHRAPLPVSQATGYAVELLDACITARRHVAGAGDTVVGSAMIDDDGALRVTRFSRPRGPGPGDADRAVSEVAGMLRDLLAGASVPPSLGRTIDDALAGRVPTPEALRGRLLHEVEERPPAPVVPPPPLPAPPRRWPWIVAAVIAVILLAGVALFFLLGDDGPTVPDVSGRSAADAVSILRGEGYSPATAGRLSADVARGIVINTTPPAGAEADEGSRVVVNVSQGTGNVAVPALTGLSQAQATAQLTDAGLEARILRAESASAPVGSVTGQDPAAGLQVPVGSTVAVTVSSGPGTTAATTVTAPATTVTVPNVVGQTADSAAATLTALGLSPGEVTSQPAPGVPEGQITAQSPAAGAEVSAGSSVDVTVSDGS